ncbi:hypothetical protein PLICRDRAFT_102810 [Plicaturopsis crispa FD-325 SS-3]|nr:hypothetical protein PLICRDRAFT_102810 [Plicaturopsis crispa FD-325 SS-3]
MANNKIAVNSAHQPGQTCLAFSRDGKYAFTGGSDTLVRIWHTNLGADQEPDAAAEAAEGITSVASANDCWLSGCADSEVRRYVQGKAELDGLVTSAIGVAIRCVAVDPKGKRVAVTSDELAVKLIELEDTIKIELLNGHAKGVRRATWHPSGSLLTTCGSDGKIIVWDVSDDTPKQEKVIEGIIPAVTDTESAEYLHDCSAVWHPSGQQFFVASRAHEIVTVSRTSWSKTATFSDDSLLGAPTALALSANGVYLASASNSAVAIWSTQTRRLLFRHDASPGATIVQLAWSPTQNLLAWTDTEGVFTRWTDPIPSSSPDPVKTSAAGAATGVQIKRKAELDLFGEIDQEPPAGDANEDVDIEFDLDNDDWIIDDVGGGMKDRKNGDGLYKELVSITKAQPPFQPGATPMENKKRYLAYNMIGVVEVTDQDTHHIVNVEFHDRSARKSYHFTDHLKYSLASIGERGVAFACQPENGHAAQVIYKPYTAWATQSEWMYTLRPDQRVLGIAAGGFPRAASSSFQSTELDEAGGCGNVVIATSEGDLTFLSGGGGERRVVGLEGDFVGMVSGGEWAFVVFRAGATTIDGSQNLMGVVICFEDYTVLQRGMLPVPKGHTLKWMGITEEGAPAIYDSAGYLHVLAKYRVPLRATWARVLDTNLLERKQGKDESYWPVGVNGNMFSCLILKGRQEHPGFPRPLIQELPMQMPFRRSDPKEAPLEEHFQRDSLFLEIERDNLGDALTTDAITRRELALDKELIQLIGLACKADKLPRALELTQLLHLTPSFDMAIRVAQFYHFPGLEEKMEAVKAERTREDTRAERARRKRREYQSDAELVPPPLRLPADGPSSRARGFDDFGPPPKIERPGWGQAKPAVETTKFTKKAPRENDSRAASVFGEPSGSGSASPLDGKRKRDREESVAYEEDYESKRNPFARKSAADTGPRNPFARKAGANKTIQKSESFFDKVDTQEDPKFKR